MKIVPLVVVSLVGSLQVLAASWEPPRTTRRYVHPPLAERMCVLFNDAKLMLSEVRHEHNWTTRDYNKEVGNVLWFFQGKEDRLFDFKTAENLLPEDGVPLHGLRWKENDVAVTLETCCGFERKTTAHGRFTVANGSARRFAEEYAIRVRYGNESTLLGGYKKQPPDYYSAYKSIPETWRKVVCDWTWDGCALHSPAGGFVTFARPVPSARWDAERGELRFAVDLEPGATFDIEFAFGIGADVQPAFEATRRMTADAWRRELAKINRLPQALRENSEHMRIVKNMVVQMLQCFCHPVGCDYVMPRQGGLQRWVWPWDNMDALSALGKIGEFGSYVESAVDFYFGLYGYGSGGYAEPENRGKIGPFGNDWDCNTANCLGILGRYCLDTGDRGPWDRYRAKALEGFRWIMRHRVPPGATDAVPGFFPVGWACDVKTKAQPWGFTDAINLIDMSDYLVAAERFGDPALAEIRAGFEDYLGTMRDKVLLFRRESADKEDFDIPISPDRKEVDKMYPRLYHGNMIVLGLKRGYLDANDVMRIWKWCLNNGQVSDRGLTGKYTTASDDPVMKHYWYTTSQDYLWHRAFREIGRNDLADTILAATLKYAMSRELYVGERYRDDEPWFLPWSPNCSGSGRIIQMLLEHYGERIEPSKSTRPASVVKGVPRMDRSRLNVGAYYLKASARDDAHVRDVRDCGIDFIIGVPAKDRALLDRFQRHGVGAVVGGVIPGWWGSDGSNAGTMRKTNPWSAYEKGMAKFCAELDHPAIWMIDMGDEPSALDYPYYGEVAAFVRSMAPAVGGYLNIYPAYAAGADLDAAQVERELGAKTYREHVESYCREVPLDYLCFDFYPYTPDRTRRPSLLRQMYESLDVAANACRRSGRSLWFVAQVNSYAGERFEPTTENRLRFQAYSAMAHGAEVVTWACWSPGWWTNNVLTASGEKTEQYDRLRTVNAELHRLGRDYMRYRNCATHCVGMKERLPAGLTDSSALDTGFFRGVATAEGTPLLVGEMMPRGADDGARAIFAVASGDPYDEKPACRTLRFRVAGDRRVEAIGPNGAVALARDADGVWSCPLSESSAVLIVARPVCK